MAQAPQNPLAHWLGQWPVQRWQAAVQTTLARLSARERQALTLAAWVLGLGLLWWLALAPALQTLRQAPERHARLDAQLSQMRSMAATAELLRAQNPQPLRRDATLRALEQATAELNNTAQLTVLGDRATLTLRNTESAALAQWLAQVRLNARLVPLEAQLSRTGDAATWSGSLVLAGPGLSGS